MYFDIRLWVFTEGVRLRIAATVVLGLLAAVVGVARLAALGWLLARVLEGESFSTMLQSFIVVAMLMLLRGILEYGRNMLAHHTSARVQVVLRKILYDKIIELGPAHFGLHRTGDVLLSVVDGVEQLEIYFGRYIPQVFIAVLVPIAIFIFVFFLDWPVAGIMLIFSLVTLFAPILFHTWDRNNAKARQKAYAEFGAEFLDTLQGLATLQAFGQSASRGRLLAEKSHELFKRTMWVLATNSLTRGITDTGMAVGVASMLTLGAYRVTQGQMSLEVLLMILMMGIEVFRPLRELRELLHSGMMGQSASRGILNLLDQKPLISGLQRTASTSHLHQNNQKHFDPTIRFESVTFSYPGTKHKAHHDLNFEVRAGERIGIVGPSGCGKSTVARLLLRLYDPQKGVIRLGGQDLRKISMEKLYQNIAVVQQETYLFHGSVAENLRFGKPDATEVELMDAAKIANAHDFIAQLPQGYYTVIGERGIKLSGGQRQRIAIARAMLRDAPLLLLDEALSAVDSENEAIIQEALGRAMAGRTTLVFAHRLSSVIDSDRIFVLDQGTIVEQGSHTELLRKGGPYHSLMAGQMEESHEDYLQKNPVGVNRDVTKETFHWEKNSFNTRFGPHDTTQKPDDEILRAEGPGWIETIRHLMLMIAPWRGKLILTFILGVTRVVALIGVGIVSALIVASVKIGIPYDALFILLFVIAPLAGLLHWLESWIAHDMAFRLLSELRIALYQKIDALGPAYMTRRRSGDLVGSATHDVELVEFFFAHTVAPTFVAILVPVVVVLTLVFHGPLMVFALLPFLILVGLSPFMLRRRIDELGSRAREALGNLNAHVVDTIQGLIEVIAFQQTRLRRQELVQKTKLHHLIRLPFFRDLTLQTAILEVATGLGGLAVAASGAYLVNIDSLNSSILPLLTLISMAAFLPVSEIAHIGRQLADTLGATRRLYAVRKEPLLVQDGPGIPLATGVLQDPVPADLQMDHVTFSYLEDGRYALRNVNFKVPKGKTLALVGPSGSGKTTIAHLMMRFWDPQEGLVRFQGVPLRQYRLEELRKNISLVTQDTYLFNTTLRENIRIARPTANEDEIAVALQRAALEEFISSLPEGLETAVGERGVRLSGGQRQRVAIARAFLKDAPVLILDEATSHLDAANEKLVHLALEELMHDRTTVVIAHRLSTIRNAHTIVVLENGQVVETGPHIVLAAKGGLYSQLIDRQIEALFLNEQV